MDHTKIVEREIIERLASGNDDSFYVLDLEDVRTKYRKWIEQIPRVKPFYAVKCNDDDQVVKLLAELGCGFDCASEKEVAQIMELGVAPDRIIYANTAKQESHLKFASEKRVMRVTFDSHAELLKTKRFHPEAQVVLRIRFDSENAIVCLGVKFGCDPAVEAPELMKLCKENEMNLIGISFHVGSGTYDCEIFERALAQVRQLFDVATEIGFDLKFVDIGGGFIGSDLSLLNNYAKSINAGIQENFADPSYEIIAEPGRYFVESAYTLATQIILKKVARNGHINYYINEGIFMSFFMNFISKGYIEGMKDFKVIRKSSQQSSIKRLSTIWGSSCNSSDKILWDFVTQEMEMGDWLVFKNMGAYTRTASRNFNGFKIGDVVTINEGWRSRNWQRSHRDENERCTKEFIDLNAKLPTTLTIQLNHSLNVTATNCRKVHTSNLKRAFQALMGFPSEAEND